jgi:hypothetical protein
MSRQRRESDTAPHRSILHLRNDSNVLGGMSKLLGNSRLILRQLTYSVANRSEIATRIFRTAHELSMYITSAGPLLTFRLGRQSRCSRMRIG